MQSKEILRTDSYEDLNNEYNKKYRKNRYFKKSKDPRWSVIQKKKK